MSIKSIIANYSIDNLGAASGNYLHFDEKTNHWSVVKISCLGKAFRGIGIGYRSTRLAHIRKNLNAASAEPGLEALLLKIDTAWKKKFPDPESSLNNKVGAPAHDEEKGASSVSSGNETKLRVQVRDTTISIEEGKLTESGVECILFPLDKLPNYIVTGRPAFQEIAKAIGFDRELAVELTGAWQQSPEQAASLPPITNTGKLAAKGITKILFPKKIAPSALPDPTQASEQKKDEQYVDFLTKCLDCARNEGVTNIAFYPQSLIRSGKESIQHITKLNFMVIDHYIQDHPAAFTMIKLVYNTKLIYKAENPIAAHDLETVVSTCRAMSHPYGEVVE